MTRSIFGCWLMKSCFIQNSLSNEKFELEGTKFILSKTGDVAWLLENDSLKDIPLFSCETFTIDMSNYNLSFKFGVYGDNVIEFKAQLSGSMENMILKCEGWSTINCVKCNNIDFDCSPNEDLNFLAAVEEGFFSDITIEAQDHKKFFVHSTIMSLLGPDIQWSSKPPPFTGLPEGVVGTIVHWMYTECLPSGITEEVIVQVIDVVKDYPCMSKLVQKCNVYIKNMNLRQQITELTTDIHICLDNIIGYFNEPGNGFECNPGKLCLVIKQSAREAAVAILKIVILCDLFIKRKTELSRHDQHAVINFALLRMPKFVCQIKMLLETMKMSFSSLTLGQRIEIATYLVPEIESALEILSELIFDLKISLEHIMQAIVPENQDFKKELFADVPLQFALKKVLRVQEYTKLKDFHHKITYTLMHLLQKKECFADMSTNNKIRFVVRNLEQIVDELPIFLLRLEEFSPVDNIIQWREFKLSFKVATSKVSGILSKLIANRDTFKDVITKFCALVQRDAFTLGLVNLGVLQSASQVVSSSELNGDQELDQDRKLYQGSKSTSNTNSNINLNLSNSLFKPPEIHNSKLSEAAGELLESERFSDMVFEIVVNNPQSTKSPITLMNQQLFEKFSVSSASTSMSNIQDIKNTTAADNPKPNNEEYTSVIIKSHRVIVAARCDWFRRALQSGMKEAIHKRIVIHDTTPVLFRKLLHYLYTGKLDTNYTTAEQLIELVLLGDRYELDALKLTCEKVLSLKHLEKDNIMFYLNLADQYNADHLKGACINYIAGNEDMIRGDTALDSLDIWDEPDREKDKIEALIDRVTNDDSEISTVASLFSYVGDSNSEQARIKALLERVNIDEGSNSECSSVEDVSVDRGRLNDCLAHLRDVLGSAVPLEDLNKIALAADCDPNRAINFYYSSNYSTNDQDDS